MNLIIFIKTFFKTFFQIRKDKKIYDSAKYYTDLNIIPLYNWWQCDQGDLTYLWHERQTYIPAFFKTVFHNMTYQFDYLDLELLRKFTEANYYENKYLSTNDIKYKRKADTRKAEIEQLKNEKTDTKEKLNDIIWKVQKELNLTWQIDPLKISAGYFFNLINQIRNGNN